MSHQNFMRIFMTCLVITFSAQAQFPTIRNPLYWPFADTSIWNMPIGSNAQYVPARIGPSLGAGMTDDEDILLLNSAAPLVMLEENNAGWDATKRRCTSLTGRLLYQVPIPTGFSTDPGYVGTTPNMSAAFLLPDNRTLKQNQPFHRCGAGGTATTQVLFPDVDLYGSGIPGAHGGSGLSAIGGTVRVGELLPGSTIRHALKCNLYAAKYIAYNNDGTRGYRWPARNADGYANGVYAGLVPALEQGALLALLPNFNVAGLRTGPARILAQAFKDYGAYVVDDTYWDVYGIEVEWGPNGRVLNEFQSIWGWPFSTNQLSTCASISNECSWAKDMADIFINLNVVDNNSASSIGGGGTRRTPLAPVFGPAVRILTPTPVPNPMQSLQVGTYSFGMEKKTDLRGRKWSAPPLH